MFPLPSQASFFSLSPVIAGIYGALTMDKALYTLSPSLTTCKVTVVVPSVAAEGPKAGDDRSALVHRASRWSVGWNPGTKCAAFPHPALPTRLHSTGWSQTLCLQKGGRGRNHPGTLQNAQAVHTAHQPRKWCVTRAGFPSKLCVTRVGSPRRLSSLRRSLKYNHRAKKIPSLWNDVSAVLAKRRD